MDKKESLCDKAFEKVELGRVARETGISAQTARRVEHDPDNVRVATWMRLMAWVQDTTAVLTPKRT